MLPGRKPIWRWYVQDAAGVIRVLNLLMPMLGARRQAQAEIALQAAWSTIYRQMRRHGRETLFGYRVSSRDFHRLARALGEECV